MATMRKIQYYAVARNPEGKIGQLLVTRDGGRQVSQEWTGKTYADMKDAEQDMIRLNCG